MSIRVLLADDHTIVREGLRWILKQSQDIEIVAEADNGRDAIKLAHQLLPDVVLMDIAMADLNGMEAARQILADNPTVKIVALSAYDDRRYVMGMLDAGATAYVLKANAGDELLQAVQAVLDGKTYLTPEVADKAVDNYTHRPLTKADRERMELGPREREVLQLVAEGNSSAQVAARLKISIRTVDAHRRNIMRKLDLHSVADLTKYAVRQGLTRLDG